MKHSFIFILFALISLSTAKNCNVPYQKAVQFFEAKQYTTAAEQFNRCLDLGVINANIYYNIGNAHHKAKNFALAILNYEKALKIDPKHSDAIHNLLIAESEKVDKQVSTDRTSLPYKILYYIPINLSLNLTVALLLTWLTLVLFSRKKSDRAQFKLYTLAVIIFVFALPITASTSYRIYQIEFQKSAILLSPQTQVLTGPSKNSSLLSTLHSGYKLQVIEQKNEWIKVQFENTYGWVKKKDLGFI